MFQTTRRRLALWYTIVTAMVLLLFAVGVYLYVRNTLVDRIDDTLNHVVEVVERSLVIEPLQKPDDFNTKPQFFQVNIEASFRNRTESVDDDRIDLEWFNPTGDLLWSTFSEPLNLPLHPNRNGETVRIGQGNSEHSEILLRQVTDRVQIGRQVLGYLRVSHPWFEVTKPSRQLIVDLSIGLGLMITSVAAIGWLLSGLAMEPVWDSYQRLKQFTADASHELRSPIATIQTNVQAAIADLDSDSSQYRQQLQVIERLTRRMGRLVDDLLFLARQDSGIIQPQWQSVPLDALLIEVLEEQQLLANNQGVTLNLALIDPILETDDTRVEAFTLPGDWNQLTRLFINLVRNALQHTPSGGEVEVKLQQWVTKHGSSQLQVQVKDTGIGIPKEALPQIFERFYRVDPARSHLTLGRSGDTSSGSGLGLAIARAIVDNHRGKITIDSQLNQGTVITVLFGVEDGQKPIVKPEN